MQDPNNKTWPLLLGFAAAIAALAMGIGAQSYVDHRQPPYAIANG